MVQARWAAPRCGGQTRRRRWRLALAGLCALGLALTSSAAESDSAAVCEPWPGEPAPLPRTDDPDPLLARWAALRVRELSTEAGLQRRDAPGRADRLWQRVLCLEPDHPAAIEGLARTPSIGIHHPLLVARGQPRAAADPWNDLGEPLAVLPLPRRTLASSASPASLAPESERSAAPPPDPMGEALESVQESLRGARFEDALARAERGRRELSGSASPARVAELEVLAATAALALDRKEEAAASLRRALAANPMLTLDPMQTPPKVRRAFDRVRAGASL